MSEPSTVMIATSTASFIAALAARRSYTSEFYASLRQGYLDLTSPLIDFTPDQVQADKGQCCRTPTAVTECRFLGMDVDFFSEGNVGEWRTAPSQLRLELVIPRTHGSFFSGEVC